MAGAGAYTRDNPQRLADFDPAKSHVGGLFDDKKRLQPKQHAIAASASVASSAQVASKAR